MNVPRPHQNRWSWVSSLSLSLALTTGCAVHYYDKRTGTEHLWGFGYMKMKVLPPCEGVEAVIKGTQIAGLKIGADDEGFALVAGWDKCRRIYLNPTNCSVRLEWPDGDFFNVRVGSLPPFRTNSNPTGSRINPEKIP